MTDSNFNNLPKKTKRLVLISQIKLFLVSFITNIWPIITITAIYLTFAIYNLFEYINDYIHLLLLLAYILSMIFFIRRAILNLKPPSKKYVIRLLEKSSKLKNRPLNNLTDSLSQATQGEQQKQLWKFHLIRAKKQLSKLYLLKTAFSLKKQNPYGIGYIAIFLLFLGFFVAGNNINHKIKTAFTIPSDIKTIDIIPSDIIPDMFVTAWTVPPKYTKLPESYLYDGELSKGKITAKFDIPKDSNLIFHISNVKYTKPKLYINDTPTELTINEKGSYSLDKKISHDTEIKLSHMFLPKIYWKINVVEDRPPQIAIDNKVNITDREEIEISYRASDDYGIKNLELSIAPDKNLLAKLENAPLTKMEKQKFTQSINIPPEHIVKNLDEVKIIDLTPSIFAGYGVTISIQATDSKRHTTNSNLVNVNLPKRKFTNQIAKEIAKIREVLIWQKDREKLTKAWEKLTTIAHQPIQYKEDKGIYLSLIVSSMALERAISEQNKYYTYAKKDGYEYKAWLNNMQNIRKTLWDIAINIEDGNLTVATQNLQDALDNLSEKLKNKNLSEEEFNRLVQELQETMAKYMQALSEELQEKSNQQQNGEQKISNSIFDKVAKKMKTGNMFEKWQKFSETGSKKDLQEVLDEIKKMMEQMDPEKIKNAKPLDMKEFEDAQKLQELVEKQQKLIEKTNKEQDKKDSNNNKQEQKKQQLSKDKNGKAELTNEQKNIKEQLKKLAGTMEEKLGGMPKTLPEADKSMQNAIDMLKEGDFPVAVKHEQKALDAMQEAMDGELERLAKMMENVISIGGGGRKTGPEDPLGRKEGFDEFDTSDIDIPEEMEQRKIQEIIKELRNRSNDYFRPKFEKDYLERLLKRFQ